ncbi:MAG: hypothetical protein AAF677_09620 [Pseudomonadota bacterium]
MSGAQGLTRAKQIVIEDRPDFCDLANDTPRQIDAGVIAAVQSGETVAAEWER